MALKLRMKLILFILFPFSMLAQVPDVEPNKNISIGMKFETGLIRARNFPVAQIISSGFGNNVSAGFVAGWQFHEDYSVNFGYYFSSGNLTFKGDTTTFSYFGTRNIIPISIRYEQGERMVKAVYEVGGYFSFLRSGNLSNIFSPQKIKDYFRNYGLLFSLGALFEVSETIVITVTYSTLIDLGSDNLNLNRRTLGLGISRKIWHIN